MTTSIGLPHVHSGKVRDIYDLGDDRLLMIASDRMSAFDVVMDEPIPDKGRVLTAFSAYWFERLGDLVRPHLLSTDVGDLPDPVCTLAGSEDLAGRIMICEKAEMIPVECIVRGYLSGTAWAEYQRSGSMHSSPMPDGLIESDRLPEPVFTPSRKADIGEHDENISFEQAAGLIGLELAERLRDVSLALYRRGSEIAAQRGVIIADTKFEFGLIDGDIVLCDEVLTPDSSRLWAAERWQPGRAQDSFDKQPLRDYLDGLDWNKEPPPPSLSPAVVRATHDRYVEAYERVTGFRFADWPGVSKA